MGGGHLVKKLRCAFPCKAIDGANKNTSVSFLFVFYENMLCLSTMMILKNMYICVCVYLAADTNAEPIWYKNESSTSYTPKRVKHEVVFIKGRTVVCSADIRMYV